MEAVGNVDIVNANDANDANNANSVGNGVEAVGNNDGNNDNAVETDCPKTRKRKNHLIIQHLCSIVP